jgi:aspartate/methionine/tyrosine aminotransferase
MTVSTTIDLSAPRLSLTTSVAVREAAKAALDAGATHYTDRPGIADLREAVALKLAEVNRIAVAPADEVLITCGIQEALFLALQVLAGTGNEVIVTGPALRADIELVRMVGAVARIAPADDRLRLDIGGVRDLISDDTKVLLLRSPSGSGEVLCDETLERLGALAVEHDLRVVAVETDEALTAADVDHRSIGAVGGLAPRTVTINGFSGLGLEAWRVGYLAAQRELMAPMKRLKQELSICSPAVSQYAALDAIRGSEDATNALRHRLGVRRAAIARGFEQAGLEHVVAEAGMYVFVRPAAGMPVRTAIARAAEVGILVADGSCVGADGWLRLTLEHDPELLNDAARQLAGAIGEIPAQTA